MALELYDKDFLFALDQSQHKEIYCKIIALNWEENPIAEITSNIVSGTINVDGSSAVRRTANLSLVTNNLKLDTIAWRAQTKIKILVGVKNNLSQYKQYEDIIWFPQGVFVITSFNSNLTAQGYTITISAKDKMCLLNGDVGGTLWASHDFSQLYITQDDGNIIKKYIPIKDIIREAIHTYALEPYSNIIIKDLDQCGVELLEYIGTNATMYIFRQAVNADQPGAVWTYQIAFDTSSPQLASVLEAAIAANNGIDEGASITPDGGRVTYIVQKRISPNSVDKIAGYRATDVTYSGELTISVGQSINDLLKKIADLLGEFEYFYNLEGRFVFQRKKIYINTVWTNVVTYENTTYYESMETATDLAYDFAHGLLVSSFSNNPQLNKIKNDFSIWGTRKTASGKDINVHLRYAIDKKPTIYYSLLDQTMYKTKEKQGIYDWRELIYQMAKDNLYADTAISSLKLALSYGTMYHTTTNLSWNNRPFYKYNISTKRFTQINSELDFNNCIMNKVFLFKSTQSLTAAQTKDLIEEIKEWQQTYVTGYEAYYADMLAFWRYMYKISPDFNRSGDNQYLQQGYNLKNYERRTDGQAVLTYEKDGQIKEVYYGTDEIDNVTWQNEWQTNGFWNPDLFNYNGINAEIKEPTALYFWIDFCDISDSTNELAQYSIGVAGRRPKYLTDKDVTAIYFRETPSLLFIDLDSAQIEGEENLHYCRVNIVPPISNYFKISTQGKSAKEALDALLYDNTLAQESITLSTIPIYYLEPNTRIRVFDENTNINGEYIIKSLSIPLSADGFMSISANRAAERVL